MKKAFILTITIFLAAFVHLFSQQNDSEKIEDVIINSYINGLIDAEDFEKAKEGIHEDFVILGNRDGLLTKKTRDAWIAQRRKRTNLPKVTYTIVFIDITENAASAKIELKREHILATDYVFLYKLNGLWKIVSAIDHVKRISKK